MISVFKTVPANQGVEMPVPATGGYIKAQVHPSICYIPNGWNGYTHWMAGTPWNSNDHENPMLYWANKDVNGSHPRVFTPHPNNPIVPKQPIQGQYNADPELIFDETGNGGNGRMFLFWKDSHTAVQGGGYNVGWKMKYSDNGVDWSAEKIIYVGNEGGVSLMHIKKNGKFYVFLIQSVANDAQPKSLFWKLRRWELSNLNNDDLYLPHVDCNVKIKGHYHPWHSTAFQYEGVYYMICNTYRKNPVLGIGLPMIYRSYDMLKWEQISKIPLVNLNSYRPTAFVDENGLLIYYQAIITGTPLQPYTDNGQMVVLHVTPFKTMIRNLDLAKN